jgi:DNA-binding LacI/PurR family transcriptional regulator
VAAQHLLDLGHRHVGVLTGGLGPEPRIVPPTAVGEVVGRSGRERLLGWLDALQPAGARVVVANHPYGCGNAAAAARLLLDAEDAPSAVLCFSDAMAADLVHVAEELGGRVPDDVSVIGFDDSPLAGRMRPPLTTVRQDADAKGRAAAHALHDAIERTRAGLPAEPRRVLLPTELVVRGTTAAHPAP